MGKKLVQARSSVLLPELVKAAFWSQIEVNSLLVCWPWYGRINNDGYGLFYIGDNEWRCHQIAWSIINKIPLDEVPEVLHHKCCTKPCCNVRHLEAHTRRSHPDGGGNWQLSKTHCPKGHPYSGENLLIIHRSNGLTQRGCRTCRKKNRMK